MVHAENAKNKNAKNAGKKPQKYQNTKLFTIYKYISKNFKQTLNLFKLFLILQFPFINGLNCFSCPMVVEGP